MVFLRTTLKITLTQLSCQVKPPINCEIVITLNVRYLCSYTEVNKSITALCSQWGQRSTQFSSPWLEETKTDRKVPTHISSVGISCLYDRGRSRFSHPNKWEYIISITKGDPVSSRSRTPRRGHCVGCVVHTPEHLNPEFDRIYETDTDNDIVQEPESEFSNTEDGHRHSEIVRSNNRTFERSSHFGIWEVSNSRPGPPIRTWGNCCEWVVPTYELVCRKKESS